MTPPIISRQPENSQGLRTWSDHRTKSNIGHVARSCLKQNEKGRGEEKGREGERKEGAMNIPILVLVQIRMIQLDNFPEIIQSEILHIKLYF